MVFSAPPLILQRYRKRRRSASRDSSAPVCEYRPHHVLNLMAKLGVHSMLEAVALASDDPAWLYEDGTTLS